MPKFELTELGGKTGVHNGVSSDLKRRTIRRVGAQNPQVPPLPHGPRSGRETPGRGGRGQPAKRGNTGREPAGCGAAAAGQAIFSAGPPPFAEGPFAQILRA
jgi:hypothetical protein